AYLPATTITCTIASFRFQIHHPHGPSFPTRRSSDLRLYQRAAVLPGHEPVGRGRADPLPRSLPAGGGRDRRLLYGIHLFDPAFRDRKSTRLNSSHVSISYAVF